MLNLMLAQHKIGGGGGGAEGVITLWQVYSI